MRILHTVEQYPPCLGGMAEVVQQLSTHLVNFGHEVTVATGYHPQRQEATCGGVKVEAFQVTGNAVDGMRGEYQRYQEFLLKSKFDIIVNFAAQQWATDLMLPIIQQIQAKKILVPTGFSALYNPVFQDYFSFLATVMKQYDMNIFLSKEYQDFKFAKQAGVDKLCIIPNGASAAEFEKSYDGDIRSQLGIAEETFIILHVGSHTGLKGHQEAIKIFYQAPLQNAVFIIVGNSANLQCQQMCCSLAQLINSAPECQACGKRVIITELSRGDTIGAYQAADLFLFPSNIECSPIVLFECMASKTPFLTTDVGNAKEIINCSGAGLLLPTTKDARGLAQAEIAESAVLLSQLYVDKDRRIQLADQGFAAWKKHFTWESISRKYERVYSMLVADPKTANTDWMDFSRQSVVASAKKKPLLSICLPTYNRAELLRIALLSLLPQVEEVQADVELIIADNCSTDNTADVVSVASSYGTFKYIRHAQNYGPVWNTVASPIHYAQGEFCWIIGDDDMINQGALKKIVEVIKNNLDLDYFFINYYGMHVNDRNALILQNNSQFTPDSRVGFCLDHASYRVDKWDDLFKIDNRHPAEMFTAVVHHLFRRSLWIDNAPKVKHWADKQFVHLKDLDSTYPHLKIIAGAMAGRPAYYMGEPMILLGYGSQEWSDIMTVNYLGRLSEVLEYYEEIGLDAAALHHCKNHYMNACIPELFKLVFGPAAAGTENFVMEEFLARYGKEEVFVKAIFNYLINLFNYRYPKNK